MWWIVHNHEVPSPNYMHSILNHHWSYVLIPFLINNISVKLILVDVLTLPECSLYLTIAHQVLE